MGNPAGSRPSSGQGRAHHLHLPGEPGGRRRACAEEPVTEPDRAPQSRLGVGSEPERRVRLLSRLGLHRRVIELPELPVEGDSRLRPQGLHQRQALGEPGDVAVLADAERRERPGLASGADTDLQPAAAELIQRAQRLGQMGGTVQRRDQHDAAQSQPLRARRRIRHRLDGPELRRRREHVLLRPGALEAQLLDPAEVGAEGGRVELAVAVELRNGDREPHTRHRNPGSGRRR